MPLHLRPATEEDLPAISDISTAAYHPTNDALHRVLFPLHLQPTNLPDGEATRAWISTIKGNSIRDPKSIVRVCVDDALHGKVVGFILWNPPAQDEQEHDTPFQDSVVPSGMDPSARAHMIKILSDDVRKYFGDKGLREVWHGDSMAVDPQYRRRGIARMLMNWGLQQAASQQKDCYIVATLMGRPLYLDLGFTDLTKLDIFGITLYSMIKEYQPDEGELKVKGRL